jgi:Mg2+ and Co2+ transporter CorA
LETLGERVEDLEMELLEPAARATLNQIHKLKRDLLLLRRFLLNEIMRVLTVIATLFMPLTFITGLYGMNFDHTRSPWNMPELGWYYGYPLALLVIVATAVGMLIYFKRKKWM